MENKININTGGGRIERCNIGGQNNQIINQCNKIAEAKGLAEAAAEIQQLLEQLSQTYSSAEAEQTVAENLANKANKDPSFKQRLKAWRQSLLSKGSEIAATETVKEGVKRVIPLALSLLI